MCKAAIREHGCVTQNIAPGGNFNTLASSIAPNFHGYMIVVCNFAYGHGFAFVSDIGARNVATSYVATTICRDRKWNLGHGQ